MGAQIKASAILSVGVISGTARMKGLVARLAVRPRRHRAAVSRAARAGNAEAMTGEPSGPLLSAAAARCRGSGVFSVWTSARPHCTRCVGAELCGPPREATFDSGVDSRSTSVFSFPLSWADARLV